MYVYVYMENVWVEIVRVKELSVSGGRDGEYVEIVAQCDCGEFGCVQCFFVWRIMCRGSMIVRERKS
jgi:hypothetical protein